MQKHDPRQEKLTAPATVINGLGRPRAGACEDGSIKGSEREQEEEEQEGGGEGAGEAVGAAQKQKCSYSNMLFKNCMTLK